MSKSKRILFVVIFASLASQIKFNYITDGFIVAMSVVVMSIFIYCYEDMPPIHIGIGTGICSPLFRMMTIGLETGNFEMAYEWAIPDATFFFSYGIFYTLIYRYIIRRPKDIKNYPFVAFSCDFLANCMEIASRGLLQEQNLFSLKVFGTLAAVALLRTILIQIILLSMETYSNLLLREENNREFRRLISQAAVFESELYVMEKNAAEIEDIMKQAFSLYQEMENTGVAENLRIKSLDISKNAHEVKGDYMNILGVLKETYLDNVHERKLRMRDIIDIERANLLSMVRAKDYPIEIHRRIQTDFYVEQYFKMMSIVRNLLLNAAEALGSKGGKILISLKEEDGNYILKVRDNGPGISEENMETVFYEFYSTKFDEKTGNIQRGIGLSLVKDYVEKYFSGTIRVESCPNQYTEFTVTIRKVDYEEVSYEVLSD